MSAVNHLTGTVDAREAFLARVLGWIRREVRIRRDAALLAALDDRLLADMALTPDQVATAVRYGRQPEGAAREEPRSRGTTHVMLLNLGTLTCVSVEGWN